ncbi:hypothetical protein [Quisquiliibacterium transsilvanicum]|uniref:Uncharacterized protein n=1 Tax=Quisquiliibacterium transsilvanicum TaxID=1549638 RepID=A0A7W8HH62_9BURK|nr:hypothetical protein [Quisquiliibacterium transsilvanicum]MBB5271371.1 hypothetical protein [Quisquiliibacterium transsilvanicum]
MTDDYISRIEAALEAKALTEAATPEEYASAQEWLSIVCPPTTLRALLGRLKAAEAENERLRGALEVVVAYRTGGRIEGLCRAALENTNAR